MFDFQIDYQDGIADSTSIGRGTHNSKPRGNKMKTALKGLDLLNAIQAMLIDFANKNGIILSQEFETVQKFKDFVIAFTFNSLTSIGLSVREAYDVIFSDGAFDALAERVWNENQPAA